MKKPIVLSIAGSDSGGGAGIQADIKTMTINGVFAANAITSLTAQNTMGVTGIYDVSPAFLTAQLEAVFEDLYPDAVKIGMVSSSDLIETISQSLIATTSISSISCICLNASLPILPKPFIATFIIIILHSIFCPRL